MDCVALSRQNALETGEHVKEEDGPRKEVKTRQMASYPPRLRYFGITPQAFSMATGRRQEVVPSEVCSNGASRPRADTFSTASI